MNGSAGSTALSRRALLQCGAAVLCGTRLQPAEAVVFRDLARPVSVPLADVIEPWQTVTFEAWAVGPDGRDLLLKGGLVRIRQGVNPAESLAAFCLACPHEICHVNLTDDTGAAVLDSTAPDHPVFVCPCHFSAFDPGAAGHRLGGPSPRGLFRFRHEVAGEFVQVVQVEEAALQFLA